VTDENSPDVVLVSGNTSQSENSVAVNPNDPDNALNSNNSTGTPGGGINLYGANDLYTFDYGATWQGELEGAGGTNSGDPVALISESGRWLVGFITNSFGQGVAYSDDQGVTWISVNVSSGNTLDKNHMMIDNSITSPYKGYVYDAWTSFGGSNDNDIELCVSANEGESWSSPVNISNVVNAGSHNQGVNVQCGPNGEAYALWAIYDSWPADEKALGFSSHLTEAAPGIFQDHRQYQRNQEYRNRKRPQGKFIPVDGGGCIQGDFRGNVYAVWANVGVPGVNSGSDVDVYMIRSEDNGDTWSVPVRINQDPIGQGRNTISLGSQVIPYQVPQCCFL